MKEAEKEKLRVVDFNICTEGVLMAIFGTLGGGSKRIKTGVSGGMEAQGGGHRELYPPHFPFPCVPKNASDPDGICPQKLHTSHLFRELCMTQQNFV